MKVVRFLGQQYIWCKSKEETTINIPKISLSNDHDLEQMYICKGKLT